MTLDMRMKSNTKRYMKKLVYKTFSGLNDLQDFKYSGGSVSRRTEAGVRRLERIRHKLITRFYKERGVKTRLQPSKCCPICGGARRRAGYYSACPKCYPILHWRRDVSHILGTLQPRMKSEGVKLRVEFLDDSARISANMNVAVTVRDMEGKERSGAAEILGCKAFTKLEADHCADGLDRYIMQVVLDIYKEVLEKSREYIDQNRVVFRVARGVPIPVAGPWRHNQ